METRSKMVFIRTLFAIFSASLFVTAGCHKSQPEIAEEKAIERHNQEAVLPPPTGPAFARLKSQSDYLENLHTNGLLPGVPKDPKGFFGADAAIYVTPEGGSTQEVVFWTRDKPRQDYHYIVGRVSNNSSWQITKAWHPDPSSKAIQEYPVP